MEYVMSDSQKPAELFRRSLDAFLAKDMRAWADLCAEDVLVEFPFAPEGTPSRLDGRVAIFEYLRNYPKIIDVHEIDSLEIYPTDRPGHRHRRVERQGPRHPQRQRLQHVVRHLRDRPRWQHRQLPRILEPARAGAGIGGRVALLVSCAANPTSPTYPRRRTTMTSPTSGAPGAPILPD